MWIAPGRPLVDTEQRDAVETTGRIGLNRETCGDSVDWPWRYIDSRSDFLSR
jgi:3-methyladenine DNA glycosylase Mpg